MAEDHAFPDRAVGQFLKDVVLTFHGGGILHRTAVKKRARWFGQKNGERLGFLSQYAYCFGHLGFALQTGFYGRTVRRAHTDGIDLLTGYSAID